jgi:hypothetical protein
MLSPILLLVIYPLRNHSEQTFRMLSVAPLVMAVKRGDTEESYFVSTTDPSGSFGEPRPIWIAGSGILLPEGTPSFNAKINGKFLDGIIGKDILAAYTIRLDYKQRQLVFMPRNVANSKLHTGDDVVIEGRINANDLFEIDLTNKGTKYSPIVCTREHLLSLNAPTSNAISRNFSDPYELSWPNIQVGKKSFLGFAGYSDGVPGPGINLAFFNCNVVTLDLSSRRVILTLGDRIDQLVLLIKRYTSFLISRIDDRIIAELESDRRVTLVRIGRFDIKQLIDESRDDVIADALVLIANLTTNRAPIIVQTDDGQLLEIDADGVVTHSRRND